jgi:hypothetical protein
MQGYQGGHFTEKLNGFYMVRMAMGADDQSNVIERQSQFQQSVVHMVEHAAVTGVDEYAGGPIDQVGIAVVAGCRLPDKSMNTICNLHLFSPENLVLWSGIIYYFPHNLYSAQPASSLQYPR